MKRLFAIPVFMLLFSTTVLGQTVAESVIQYQLWLGDCVSQITKVVDSVDGEQGELLIYLMRRSDLDEQKVRCLIGENEAESVSGSVILSPSNIGLSDTGEGTTLMTEAFIWDDGYLYFVAAPYSDLGIENIVYLTDGYLITVGYMTHSRNYLYSTESHEIRSLPNGTIHVEDVDRGTIRVDGFKGYFNEGGAFWMDLLVDMNGNIVDVMSPTDGQNIHCLTREKFEDGTSIDVSLVSEKEICYRY